MELTLHLRGIVPLLMHRPVLVDPFHEITQEYKSYTGKRKKTLDDLKTIYRLEWEAALYHDTEIGPYIPAANVQTLLRDAGKLNKLGAAVTRAVVVPLEKIPLQYSGPRGTNGKGTQEMYDANLKDIRVIGVQQNSTMRCRPMFPNWELTVPLSLEESILDPGDVSRIAERAGQMIGLGDYRPRFGRFEVV